jgi:hypothetical protein
MGLQGRLSEYVNGLKKAETRTAKLEAAGKSVLAKGARESESISNEAKEIMGTTAKQSTEMVAARQAEAEKLIASANESGNAVTRDAAKRAKDILTSDTPAESIGKMIKDDPANRLKEVAGLFKNSPEGKKILAQGIHSSLMSQPPSSIKKLWFDKLGPAIADSGIMPVSQIRQIESQIADIESAYGKNTPKGGDAIKRLLIKTIAGYGGSVVGQATSGNTKSSQERLKELGVEPRAEGGPVQEGKPYLVGENGPELIVPQGSGTVIPNQSGGFNPPNKNDLSDQTLSNMDFGNLQMLREMNRGNPDAQKKIAPVEHKRWARDETAQNPMKGLAIAALTPPYSAFKAINDALPASMQAEQDRGKATPASLAEMAAGFQGVGQGMSDFYDNFQATIKKKIAELMQ